MRVGPAAPLLLDDGGKLRTVDTPPHKARAGHSDIGLRQVVIGGVENDHRLRPPSARDPGQRQSVRLALRHADA